MLHFWHQICNGPSYLRTVPSALLYELWPVAGELKKQVWLLLPRMVVVL